MTQTLRDGTLVLVQPGILHLKWLWIYGRLGCT